MQRGLGAGGLYAETIIQRRWPIPCAMRCSAGEASRLTLLTVRNATIDIVSEEVVDDSAPSREARPCAR